MSMYKGEEVLEKVIQSLVSWKKLILEIYDDDDENEKTKQLDILKSYVDSYSQIEVDYKKIKIALQKLDEKLDTEESCEDVDGLFKECYDSLAAGSNNNYQDTSVWQGVFRGISDVREIRKKKKKIDDSNFEELSDSLSCANIFAPPLDPISKVVIKNAYKSRKCGHVYEYETISDYIRRMKSKAKCPYVGCNDNQLKMTDLIQDGELQSQITQYLETHNNDSESEEEE